MRHYIYILFLLFSVNFSSAQKVISNPIYKDSTAMEIVRAVDSLFLDLYNYGKKERTQESYEVMEYTIFELRGALISMGRYIKGEEAESWKQWVLFRTNESIKETSTSNKDYLIDFKKSFIELLNSFSYEYLIFPEIPKFKYKTTLLLAEMFRDKILKYEKADDLSKEFIIDELSNIYALIRDETEEEIQIWNLWMIKIEEYLVDHHCFEFNLNQAKEYEILKIPFPELLKTTNAFYDEKLMEYYAFCLKVFKKGVKSLSQIEIKKMTKTEDFFNELENKDVKNYHEWLKWFDELEFYFYVNKRVMPLVDAFSSVKISENK